MHGLGNDFAVIDATRAPVGELLRAPSPALLDRLTDRRFGVGRDQVLLIEPALAADVDTAPVAQIGEELQHHPAFPQRVNAGFVQFLDSRRARLRVYERGAGETLACGSGACAAMAVGRLWGRLDARTEIQVRGGSLQLEWGGEGEPVWMTGPAETVYEGSLEWPK